MGIGSIPTSWCSALDVLHVDNNPWLCYESGSCYESIGTYSAINVSACATEQDLALCGFVAATDVASVANDWVCTAIGIATGVCGSGFTGVACNSGVVESISLVSLGITGE